MTHALAISELVTEEIELLPARETLAWLNVANVTATNLALAQNVASFARSPAPAPTRASSSCRRERLPNECDHTAERGGRCTTVTCSA